MSSVALRSAAGPRRACGRGPDPAVRCFLPWRPLPMPILANGHSCRRCGADWLPSSGRRHTRALRVLSRRRIPEGTGGHSWIRKTIASTAKTAINPAFNAVARDDFGAMLDCRRYNRALNGFSSNSSPVQTSISGIPKTPTTSTSTSRLRVMSPSSRSIWCPNAIPPSGTAWTRAGASSSPTRRSGCGSAESCTENKELSVCRRGWRTCCSMPALRSFALNQAREEGRHVHAFARYMTSRFGGNVMAPTATVDRLLREMVASEVIYEKLIGMQMLVEGLAMGLFTQIFQTANDPVLKRLTQLVMTDEAFHHRFGVMWGQGECSRPERGACQSARRLRAREVSGPDDQSRCARGKGGTLRELRFSTTISRSVR